MGSVHAAVSSGEDERSRGGAVGQRAEALLPRRGRRRGRAGRERRGRPARRSARRGCTRRTSSRRRRRPGPSPAASSRSRPARRGRSSSAARSHRAFGLALEQVRVRAAPLGGAFGGKVALIEPLVAGAALALRRPVRLTLTRSEDFQATNPAPAQLMELRAGATRSGKLTALEARVVCDRGATPGLGPGGHRVDPRRRAVPLGGVRDHGLRRRRRTASRSAPTAGRGPRAPRSRSSRCSTSSLTSSSSTRSSSGSRTPSSRETSA